MSRKKSKQQKGKAAQPEKPSRRKFLTLGLGGIGALAVTGLAGYKAGWFDASPSPAPPPAPALAPVALQANYQNALRAADEITGYYARELNTPSALIHAVRAFGKDFKLADGANAVDHLCSKYFAEQEVNGKKYIYVPREYEVHDNSFLKTLLEMGVSLDQPITAGGNKYTLRDLGESAKALFRFDPQNLGRYDPTLVYEHVAWGLIAFSILVPPSQPKWTNAYGETINLNQVIDRTLAHYEGMCDGLHDSLERGEEESLGFRQELAKHSCAGMHSIYAFFSCLKAGYRDHNLQGRARQMFDLTTYRLKGDPLAIDREANAAKDLGPDLVNRLAVSQDGKVVTRGAPPPQTIEMMRLRTQIRFMGHSFEAINYAQLHKLVAPNAGQRKRLEVGENLLFDQLVKLRATDLKPYWNWYSKFIGNLVIAVAHAARALKLLTPGNPGNATKS